MPSLAKHHLLRAYLPLMVPFRTRFSRHEVVHVAYVQRLMGYLYTSWWSTTFLLYASRHTGLSHPTMTIKPGCWALDRLRARSIAGLFPQPSSEPDVKLIASSGSPVSVSLRSWPIGVDVHMAPPAQRDALAFACDHGFHPERFLPSPLFVEVG